MRGKKILKTSMMLGILLIITSTNVFALSQETFPAKHENNDKTSEWQDIGPAEVSGTYWSTRSASVWLVIGLGIPIFFLLPAPNDMGALYFRMRIHILPINRIYFRCLTDEQNNDIRINGIVYNEFILTGFTGFWTQPTFQGEEFSYALNVHGNALNARVKI